MASSAADRNLTLLEPLELRDLTEEGLHFDEVLPLEWLAAAVEGGPGLQFAAVEAGRADLEVQPLGPVDQRPPVRIRGHLGAPVRTDCVRCLESLTVPLEVEIDQTLFASEGAPEEEAVYEGEAIDLPEVLRESLALELPMNPTCADTRACDTRTQKLLDDVNRPAREAMGDKPAVDPRWAALAALRDRTHEPDN
jgi:uncharacterized metal-binding protein YceD (DUF177 family)